MKKLFYYLATAFAVAMLSACGTPMALNSKTKQVDLQSESIVLFSLEVSQSDGGKVPWPRGVFVVPTKPGSKGEFLQFKIDEEGMDYTDGTRYIALARLSLPPGGYELSNVWGEITKFPFRGRWQVPLALGLEVSPRSVIYAGRISAQMRPRTDTEFRAGALIPLIDQAVTGISGSTFDVSITDSSASDLPNFREAFPALANADISTNILPAFNRLTFDREYGGAAGVAVNPAASSQP